MLGSDLAIGPRTLAVDIGGSRLKALVRDGRGNPVNEKIRVRTPQRPTPERVLAMLGGIVDRQPAFDRVAVGFPGGVRGGVPLTAANLHPGWLGLALGEALRDRIGRLARVTNDADPQGMAVIAGEGLEAVLTVRTGLGSSLCIDGRLVANLEIAHHPFNEEGSCEQCLGNAALRRRGRRKWSEHLRAAVGQLAAAFSFDRPQIGGGNSRKADCAGLRGNVTFISNRAGLLGGTYLRENPRSGCRLVRPAASTAQ